MSSSEGMKRIGYLGPEGTFTHQALDEIPEADVIARSVDAVPYPTVVDVIAAVDGGAVDGGIVPIENSVEGAITATLDGLAFGRGDLRIAAEVLLPIHFDLFVSPGFEGETLKEVLSHPHAFAQCRRIITEKNLSTRVTLSTADACRTLRDNPTRGVGAIASRKAGLLYGLSVVTRGIQDVAGAVTRFVFLTHKSPGPTGRDKTSLVLTPKHDQPGSLVDLLQEFSSRRINLARIESRPLKTQLGRYCFFIDAQGHIEDQDIGEAVRSLSRKEVDVKFLGSYANATPLPARPREVSTAKGSRLENLKPIQTVGIVGLGLIGGSIARAVRIIDGMKVVGLDTDGSTCEQAKAFGIEVAATMGDLVRASDLIVVATPVSTIKNIFEKLSGQLKSGQIVTDVGSVKQPIQSMAREGLPPSAIFIGGHPMAGSERSGFASSRSDLFVGSSWVLTFDARMDGAAYLKLAEFVLKLGARVVPLTSESHDAAVSQISHLPHLIAYTLMAQTDSSSDSRRTALDLAAGSFKDIVRVAGAAPAVWSEICKLNAGPIKESLGRFTKRLGDIQNLVQRGDFAHLTEIFEAGHKGYQRITAIDRAVRTIEVKEAAAGLADKMHGILTEIQSQSGRIDGISIESGVVKMEVSTRGNA